MAVETDTSYCSYIFYMNSTTSALINAYAADPTLFIHALSVDNLNFTSSRIALANDSASSIFFSFNGVDDHGEVKAGEVLVFDQFISKFIYLRGAAGGEAYRFWAW